MAPMPAPRPTARALLLSSALIPRTLDISWARAAPTCDAGPSMPALPPRPIAMAEESAAAGASLAPSLRFLW